MELRAWAEAIVFGETLEEKLLRPGSFADRAPGAALERVPQLPGRAAALRPSDAREAPPPLSGLEDAAARAHVLHSFANHELQALELQALALLRFPDAPPAFRQEVARVLVEEQSHLQLYLERCRELGHDLGEFGLSRYLWDALAGMGRPLDYVTGMALTFEQANLDFARDYEERFRAVGDAASAAILRRVYEEEIGHVRLGSEWLGRWAPGEDDWSAYRRLLPPALTPRRARGSGPFQREARRSAGLSERFLAELALAGGSRGRPPDLLWFRPGVERALTPGPGPKTPPRSHQALAADLSASLAFAARPDDWVLVPELPSLAWRQQLAELGLPQVEWVETGEARPGRGPAIRQALAETLGARVLGRLRPWAWDPLCAEVLAPYGAAPLPPSDLAELSGKAWAAALLERLVAQGAPGLAPSALASPLVVSERGLTCASLAEVEAAVAAERSDWRVLKAALASSGEGLRRLAPGQRLDANLRGWIERVLRGGPLRIEPWHEREADLSLVFEVGPQGATREPSLTAFRCDAQGRYRGHWIGPARRFLSGPALRLLHEERPCAGGASGLDLLQACARAAALALAERGYRGPAGIDALILRAQVPGGHELRLHPLLELNPRWTFGHLACALAKHLRRGRLGRWDLVQAREWKALGHADAQAYAQSLTPAAAEGGRLSGGALATNDPAQARAVLGVLRVAQDAGLLLAEQSLAAEVEEEDRDIGRADA